MEYLLTSDDEESEHRKLSIACNQLYVGKTTNDSPNGFGRIWDLSEGRKMFEGNFDNGKKSGFGKLYWHDENPDP